MALLNPFKTVTSSFMLKSSVIMNLALFTVIILLTISKNADIKRLTKSVADERARTELIQGNLTRCQYGRKVLQDGIDRQNASIANLATATAASTANGKRALEDARKLHEMGLSQAEALGRRAPLPPGVDQCKAANALIEETVR